MKNQDLSNALGLEREIVGVKIIKTKEEYDSIDIEQVRHGAYYCYMVKLATGGRSLKAKADNFACSASSRILGIKKELTDEDLIESYMRCNMYDSKDLARKAHESIRELGSGNYGVLVMPVSQFVDIKPDVVIIIGSPYHMMRLTQGYTYYYGNKHDFKFSGMSAVCFEMTSEVIQKKDINISTFCSGTRFICKWHDSEMGMGIPYEMYENVRKGTLKTINPCECNRRKGNIVKRDIHERLTVKMDTSYFL